ncbi:MAG: flagellar export chaperone FliS [Terriglobales bacterium]|jgi:flagellar protein FliS
MNIQQSYREATVRGASPVELVVRLYEQVIEDLRQAAIAIEHNDIMLRTKRIKHAILVVGHLQSSLDFAKGGKVARDLDSFYNAVRQSLVWVQFHPSKRGVTQLITDLLAVREAWIVVDRADRPSAASAAGMVASAAGAESDHVRVDWKG